MKRTERTRLPSLAGKLCMERPAHRRGSPMKPARRRNRLAQKHRDAFSEHGLWRCECTESEQKSTKPLICVQVISMAVAPGERTTAGRGCSPGCGPTVRVADPEVADPAHTKRGLPRVRHRKGGVFPSVQPIIYHLPTYLGGPPSISRSIYTVKNGALAPSRLCNPEFAEGRFAAVGGTGDARAGSE